MTRTDEIRRYLTHALRRNVSWDLAHESMRLVDGMFPDDGGMMTESFRIYRYAARPLMSDGWW